jgi:hypothetical protein
MHWPDAAKLAAELSDIEFFSFDRFTPHHQIVRQVRQVADLMCKLADAFDNPTLDPHAQSVLIIGTGRILSAIDRKGAGRDVRDLSEHLLADGQAVEMLFDDPWLFGSLLRQAAAEAKWQLSQNTDTSSHADQLRLLYGMVAKLLERHTRAPSSARSTGPDARFVRAVIKHAGLPWTPWIWRRYGEEWAAVWRGEIDEEDFSPWTGFVRPRRVRFCRRKISENR